MGVPRTTLDINAINFNEFPRELQALILSFLPRWHLQVIKKVNKTWYSLIDQIEESQRERRKNQCLNYLSALANGENILPFLQYQEIILPKEINLSPEGTPDLKLFCDEMGTLLPINYLHSNVNKISFDFIKQTITTILSSKSDHNMVKKAYIDFEETMAIFYFCTQFYNTVNTVSYAEENHVQACVKLLCESDHSLALTGEGLLLLNDIYVYWISKNSFQECLIKTLLQDKTNANAYFLLHKLMKAGSWEIYFSYPVEDITTKRVEYFLGALKSNHPSIVTQLNKSLLLKIVEGSHTSAWIVDIFSSSDAINILNEEDFINLAARLSYHDLKEVLKANALVKKKLTFSRVEKILSKGDYSELGNLTKPATAILEDADLLQLFTHAQIIELAKFLTWHSPYVLFRSEAFLIFLNAMPDETRENFLNKFAKSNMFLPKAMLEVPEINAMLKQPLQKTIERNNQMIKKINDHLEKEVALPVPYSRHIDNATNFDKWKVGVLIAVTVAAIVLIAVTGGVGAVLGVPIALQAILFAVGGFSVLASGFSLLYYFLDRQQLSHIQSDNISSSSAKLYRHMGNDEAELSHIDLACTANKKENPFIMSRLQSKKFPATRFFQDDIKEEFHCVVQQRRKLR